MLFHPRDAEGNPRWIGEPREDELADLRRHYLTQGFSEEEVDKILAQWNEGQGQTADGDAPLPGVGGEAWGMPGWSGEEPGGLGMGGVP